MTKRYLKLPKCENCVYFIIDNYREGKSKLRCKKFRELVLVKNPLGYKIEYDIAKECRQNEKKCGEKGNEYQEKYQWLIKRNMLKKVDSYVEKRIEILDKILGIELNSTKKSFILYRVLCINIITINY